MGRTWWQTARMKLDLWHCLEERRNSITDKRMDKNIEFINRQKGEKVFQMITLIALLFFWAGYGWALYIGNQNNISSYSLLILTFSILNGKVLFMGEKMHNRVLDVLAKFDGFLFLAWAVMTIVSLIMK